MTRYLPRCCFVRFTNVGDYEVCHEETASACRHRPSGGTAGYEDGRTPCNRIIARGGTRGEAIAVARMSLGMKQELL